MMGKKNTTSVAQYSVGSLIGEGTYGRVYMGTNRQTGGTVALKRLDMDSPNFSWESAKLEMKAGELVGGHSSIVASHDFFLRAFEGKHCMWLVLEYFDGIDLVDFMESRVDRPLSEDECRIIFEQLVKAVGYCHSKGIAHQDIKLDNVLINSSLQIKLADFGTCYWKEHPSIAHLACGSPEYLAPEMKRSSKGVDFFLADVWSLGIVLYALSFGRFPYLLEELESLSQGHRVPMRLVNAEEGSHLSFEEKDLMLRMLTANPQHRISIQEILQHPWFTNT